MKASAVVRIVVYSLITILLIGLLISGIAFLSYHKGTHFSSFPNIDDSVPIAQVAPSDIREITIHWVSGSIAIESADCQEIRVWEYSGDTLAEINSSGSALLIEYGRSSDWTSHFFGKNAKNVLRIQVPKDWVCQELTIDAVSIDLQVNGLTITDASIDCASANAEFLGSNAESLDFDCASGNLQFSGTLCDLTADGASMNLSLVLDNAPNSIQVDSMSGKLDITLPENCGFTAECDSLNGKFASEFDTHRDGDRHVFGDGICQIAMDGMSTSLNIRKGNS